MPIYEYECEACKKHHEIMQKITADPLKICPDCGGDLRKMISSTSFVLKGTGWYVTDYASKKKGDSKCSGTKTDAKKVDASVGKSSEGTDAKTDAKSESKPSPKEPAAA